MNISSIIPAAPSLISGLTEVPVAIATPTRPRVQVDRLFGALIGFVLGDALGAPHESSTSRLPYTGRLEHRFPMREGSQVGTMGIGQVTDDTEMMLALLRSVLAHNAWNYNEVVTAYTEWGATRCPGRGNLTRQLFDPPGPSAISVRTYEGRYENIYGEAYRGHALASGVNAQSNGSLMRALALALVDDPYVDQDVCLTNPCQINVEIGRAYNLLLKHALRGESALKLWNYLLVSPSSTVKQIVQAVQNGESWNLIETVMGKAKGWIIFSFFCVASAIYGLVLEHNLSYSRIMEWIIRDHPGSDTDTNAAITGAVVGALKGASVILSDPIMKENYEKVSMPIGIETQFPRPKMYQPYDLLALAEKGALLGSRYPSRI